MKTGHKISLIYSGITIGFVVLTAFIFYFCASNYTKNIYYSYLDEKAHAVAEERFSQDEVDPVKYRNVVSRRKNSIPTSKEIFINMQDLSKAREQLSHYLDENEMKRLTNNETVNFEVGQNVGSAFIYYDNTGTFTVMVLSRNPFIDDINDTLLWGVLILIALSSIILWLISRLYANKVLDRIDKDYQAEKMFVNNASHEINNPLTAIQGECEVALMMDHQPAEYRDVLERISKETNRIINIMRELLQFSHTRGEKLDQSKMQEIHISSVVAKECKGNVRLNIVNDFGIKTNEELLRIAIHNLVTNAVKYSDGSPVMVAINKPELIIQDQGIGIPESELKHIFQPFYRASNTGTVTGKGIGLALSKSILERLGATITVSSKMETGTVFRVSF